MSVKRTLRNVAALAAAFVILWNLRSLAGLDAIWITIPVCSLCVVLIAVPVKRVRTTTRSIRREYEVDSTNSRVTVPFRREDYPGARQIHSDENESGYMMPDGRLVCTRFVTRNETVEITGVDPLQIFWLVCFIFLAVLLWEGLGDTDVLALTRHRLTYLHNSLDVSIMEALDRTVPTVKENLATLFQVRLPYLFTIVINRFVDALTRAMARVRASTKRLITMVNRYGRRTWKSVARFSFTVGTVRSRASMMETSRELWRYVSRWRVRARTSVSPSPSQSSTARKMKQTSQKIWRGSTPVISTVSLRVTKRVQTSRPSGIM